MTDGSVGSVAAATATFLAVPVLLLALGLRITVLSRARGIGRATVGLLATGWWAELLRLDGINGSELGNRLGDGRCIATVARLTPDRPISLMAWLVTLDRGLPVLYLHCLEKSLKLLGLRSG